MTKLRAAYAGTPEFAVPALKVLIESQYDLAVVITQPDRKAGRGRKITQSAVKMCASDANVPVFQPENIKDIDALDYLKSLDLDMIIVAAYGQIFNQVLLDLPKYGCINIHASLLPRWRGASPIQHALLEGDEYSGVSIMQMSKAMDAGAIWFQQEYRIQDHDTAEDLHDKLAEIGGDCILEAMDIIVSGSASAVEQEQKKIKYCSKLQKKDGLVDWQANKQQIIRKIRAFYPWPGTFTYFEGRRLSILSASMLHESHPEITAGTILDSSKEGIQVACGDGVILIEEIHPEGGKRIRASDFSNANDVVGKRLTNQ